MSSGLLKISFWDTAVSKVQQKQQHDRIQQQQHEESCHRQQAKNSLKRPRASPMVYDKLMTTSASTLTNIEAMTTTTTLSSYSACSRIDGPPLVIQIVPTTSAEDVENFIQCNSAAFPTDANSNKCSSSSHKTSKASSNTEISSLSYSRDGNDRYNDCERHNDTVNKVNNNHNNAISRYISIAITFLLARKYILIHAGYVLCFTIIIIIVVTNTKLLSSHSSTTTTATTTRPTPRPTKTTAQDLPLHSTVTLNPTNLGKSSISSISNVSTVIESNTTNNQYTEQQNKSYLTAILRDSSTILDVENTLFRQRESQGPQPTFSPKDYNKQQQPATASSKAMYPTSVPTSLQTNPVASIGASKSQFRPSIFGESSREETTATTTTTSIIEQLQLHSIISKNQNVCLVYRVQSILNNNIIIPGQDETSEPLKLNIGPNLECEPIIVSNDINNNTNDTIQEFQNQRRQNTGKLSTQDTTTLSRSRFSTFPLPPDLLTSDTIQQNEHLLQHREWYIVYNPEWQINNGRTIYSDEQLKKSSKSAVGHQDAIKHEVQSVSPNVIRQYQHQQYIQKRRRSRRMQSKETKEEFGTSQHMQNDRVEQYNSTSVQDSEWGQHLFRPSIFTAKEENNDNNSKAGASTTTSITDGKVLLVRVNAADADTKISDTNLYTFVFGVPSPGAVQSLDNTLPSLKQQYIDCSQGAVQLLQYESQQIPESGVITVTVSNNADTYTFSSIFSEANDLVRQVLGIEDSGVSIGDLVQHAIYIIPNTVQPQPGSPEGIGQISLSGIDSYMSVVSDRWINNDSILNNQTTLVALLTSTGYNRGLGNAWKDGDMYGDTTGAMAHPKQGVDHVCYNGIMSDYMKWMQDRTIRFDPFLCPNRRIDLLSYAYYNATTTGQAVNIRIGDYSIIYNQKVLFNIDTPLFPNSVLVHQRLSFIRESVSTALRAAIDNNKNNTVYTYGDSGVDVIIEVCSYNDENIVVGVSKSVTIAIGIGELPCPSATYQDGENCNVIPPTLSPISTNTPTHLPSMLSVPSISTTPAPILTLIPTISTTHIPTNIPILTLPPIPTSSTMSPTGIVPSTTLVPTSINVPTIITTPPSNIRNPSDTKRPSTITTPSPFKPTILVPISSSPASTHTPTVILQPSVPSSTLHPTSSRKTQTPTITAPRSSTSRLPTVLHGSDTPTMYWVTPKYDLYNKDYDFWKCEDFNNVLFFFDENYGFQRCLWLQENLLQPYNYGSNISASGNGTAVKFRDRFCTKQHLAYYFCEETCKKCTSNDCNDSVVSKNNPNVSLSSSFFNFMGAQRDCQYINTQPTLFDMLCNRTDVRTVCPRTCQACS